MEPGDKEGAEHLSGIRVTIAKRGVMAKRDRRKLLPAVGMNSSACNNGKSACADSGASGALEQSATEGPACLGEERVDPKPAESAIGSPPKLTLLSGMEIVDRRSVNATTNVPNPTSPRPSPPRRSCSATRGSPAAGYLGQGLFAPKRHANYRTGKSL